MYKGNSGIFLVFLNIFLQRVYWDPGRTFFALSAWSWNIPDVRKRTVNAVFQYIFKWIRRIPGPASGQWIQYTYCPAKCNCVLISAFLRWYCGSFAYFYCSLKYNSSHIFRFNFPAKKKTTKNGLVWVDVKSKIVIIYVWIHQQYI